MKNVVEKKHLRPLSSSDGKTSVIPFMKIINEQDSVEMQLAGIYIGHHKCLKQIVTVY